MHGVLVAEPETGIFRFRHALLAEAIYATVLPGEREELHARIAEVLAGARLTRPSSRRTGRLQVATRRRSYLGRGRPPAEAVFGLPEGHAHVERALALWDLVPAAVEFVNPELDEVCSWAAEFASRTGTAPRAVELTRRAIELVGESDRPGAAVLYQRLSRYLFESGADDTVLAELERALELVPAQPPSAVHAKVLFQARKRFAARGARSHSPSAGSAGGRSCGRRTPTRVPGARPHGQ